MSSITKASTSLAIIFSVSITSFSNQTIAFIPDTETSYLEEGGVKRASSLAPTSSQRKKARTDDSPTFSESFILRDTYMPELEESSSTKRESTSPTHDRSHKRPRTTGLGDLDASGTLVHITAEIELSEDFFGFFEALPSSVVSDIDEYTQTYEIDSAYNSKLTHRDVFHLTPDFEADEIMDEETTSTQSLPRLPDVVWHLIFSYLPSLEDLRNLRSSSVALRNTVDTFSLVIDPSTLNPFHCPLYFFFTFHDFELFENTWVGGPTRNTLENRTFNRFIENLIRFLLVKKEEKRDSALTRGLITPLPKGDFLEGLEAFQHRFPAGEAAADIAENLHRAYLKVMGDEKPLYLTKRLLKVLKLGNNMEADLANAMRYIATGKPVFPYGNRNERSVYSKFTETRSIKHHIRNIRKIPAHKVKRNTSPFGIEDAAYFAYTKIPIETHLTINDLQMAASSTDPYPYIPNIRKYERARCALWDKIVFLDPSLDNYNKAIRSHYRLFNHPNKTNSLGARIDIRELRLLELLEERHERFPELEALTLDIQGRKYFIKAEKLFDFLFEPETLVWSVIFREATQKIKSAESILNLFERQTMAEPMDYFYSREYPPYKAAKLFYTISLGLTVYAQSLGDYYQSAEVYSKFLKIMKTRSKDLRGKDLFNIATKDFCRVTKLMRKDFRINYKLNCIFLPCDPTSRRLQAVATGVGLFIHALGFHEAKQVWDEYSPMASNHFEPSIIGPLANFASREGAYELAAQLYDTILDVVLHHGICTNTLRHMSHAYWQTGQHEKVVRVISTKKLVWPHSVTKEDEQKLEFSLFCTSQ